MEISEFVLGAVAVNALILVAVVVGLIIYVFKLTSSVRTLHEEIREIHNNLQASSDFAHAEINRVENELWVESEQTKDELSREVTRLDGQLDSRLDKLYEKLKK